MTRRLASDVGLTLVEMLITIVITGFIGASVAGSFLVFMSTNEDSSDDQAIARDQFWLNSWFLADAQSAETWTGVGVTCLDVPVEDDDHQTVAGLTWGDASAEPPTPEFEAHYRAERSSSGEPWQLVRYFCESGNTASRVVVAHSIVYPPSPPVLEPLNGRLTIRLTSAVDGTSVLTATGGPHAAP